MSTTPEENEGDPNPVLGPVGKTERGFPIIAFQDLYKSPCSLQMSSICHGYPCGESAVWLGLGGDRMHLSRQQVAALITHLSSWLETGSFEP